MPPADVYPAIATWVEARKKEGTTATDVIDALGLHLCVRGDESEEARWVLAALAVTQYRERARPRKPLAEVGTSARQAVELLRRSRRVLVVSGAGISPHVRGYQAFYSSLDSTTRMQLPEASLLFDAAHFVNKPAPFLTYCRSLLLSDTLAPTAAHRFIRALEERNMLLRNYSQNIDALESAAGIKKTLPCHGSVNRASCIACRAAVPPAALRAALEAVNADGDCGGGIGGGIGAGIGAGIGVGDNGGGDGVPRCPHCSHELNIIRPDVSFLSESHSSEAESAVRVDLPAADLLLVIGASLAVEPLRSIPSALHPSVPQILVGPCAPAATRGHAWDVELLGTCDDVVSYLARELGWDIYSTGTPAAPPAELPEPTSDPSQPNRFRFARPEPPEQNGAVDGAAGSGAGADELPPPQTPLALHPLPLPPGSKRRATARAVDGCSGATLAGSGIGARKSLSYAAPLENLRHHSDAANGADQSVAAAGGEVAEDGMGGGTSAGKRPMPPSGEAPDAKRV